MINKQFISTNKITKKARLTENRNNFYLTFFPPSAENKYPCEIEINGYWLVKSWNTKKNQPRVALYAIKPSVPSDTATDVSS